MKKSGFLTFVFSMIPGCGLMYLGYMKKGLQTMLMFAMSIIGIIFSDYSYLRGVMAIFIVLLPIIWFYQLFDAMHSLSRMKRLQIECPTDDGFYIAQNLQIFSPVKNTAAAKAIAVLLIFAGVFGIIFSLLDNLHYIIANDDVVWRITGIVRSYLIPAIVSIALIALGIKLLKGSRPKRIDVDDVDGAGGKEQTSL